MFDSDNDDFKLTDAESKEGRKKVTIGLLYLMLLLVIIVTGAHAVMLVLAQAPTYGSGDGLLAAVLNAIRIAFPILVEVAAIVAGLGFIGSKWRGTQKSVALGIEGVWFLFAAANMITFFRLERGLLLESWQLNWVNYGLPLSALIAGVLVYALTRTDPDHKRSDEETAANEKITMTRFAARRDVLTSPQMRAIERQKAWLEIVQAMKAAGYTELQMRFLLQHTPELLIDHDKDGAPDLLEDGDNIVEHPPTEPDRPTPADNGRQPVTYRDENGRPVGPENFR